MFRLPASLVPVPGLCRNLRLQCVAISNKRSTCSGLPRSDRSMHIRMASFDKVTDVSANIHSPRRRFFSFFGHCRSRSQEILRTAGVFWRCSEAAIRRSRGAASTRHQLVLATVRRVSVQSSGHFTVYSEAGSDRRFSAADLLDDETNAAACRGPLQQDQPFDASAENFDAGVMSCSQPAWLAQRSGRTQLNSSWFGGRSGHTSSAVRGRHPRRVPARIWPY